MNVDEMEAGRELDALVAEKVMGWTLIDYDTGEPVTDTEERNKALYNDGWEWQGRPGSLEAWQWHPSSSIAAAWEVVEKLKDDGLCIYTDYSYDAVVKSDYAVCEVFKSEPVGWVEIAEGDGNTMPLAICRAALKAIEKEMQLPPALTEGSHKGKEDGRGSDPPFYSTSQEEE